MTMFSICFVCIPDSLGESRKQPHTFSHDASPRINKWFLRLLTHDLTGSLLALWPLTSLGLFGPAGLGLQVVGVVG